MAGEVNPYSDEGPNIGEGDVVLVLAAGDVVFVFGMGSNNPAVKDRAGDLAPVGAAGNAQNLP